MGQIKNKGLYPAKSVIVDGDFFVMTDSENNGETVSATVQDLKQVFVGTPNNGQSNTLVNAGTGGVSVVADPSKIGVALQANSIDAGSSKTTVSLDAGNKKINIDVVDATTSQKGAVELATDGEALAGVVVQGNDSRLSDSRPPSGTAVGDLTGSYPNPYIATDAVDFTKIQNATVNGILLGSSDTGAGSDYEEITPGNNLSIVGSDLDVIPSGSTGDLQFNGPAGLGSTSDINYDSGTDSLDVDTRLTTSDIRQTGIFNSYDFESGSLAGFTTSGDVVWFATNTTSFSGSWSAQSGAISDSQISTLELSSSPTAPFNIISFAYQTSTEAEFDFLNFYIDNVLQDSFSGIQSWQAGRKYLVTAGAHTFKWDFIRDTGAGAGTNSVNIDDIVIEEVESSTDLNGFTIVNDTVNFNSSVSFNNQIQGELSSGGKGNFNKAVLWTGNLSVLTNLFLGDDQGSNVSDTEGSNTGLGYRAFPELNTGEQNTGAGVNSAKDLKTGSFNTFMGNNSGDGIEDGDSNTILGIAASSWPVSMSNNVILLDGDGNIAFRRNELDEHTIPNQTNATIVSGGAKSIITKEYGDANYLVGGSGLATKSGTEPAVSFTGNPKTATITFGAPFSDANYTPVAIGQGADNYSITVENITAAGFDINLNANPAPANAVLWTAIKHGETP